MGRDIVLPRSSLTIRPESTIKGKSDGIIFSNHSFNASAAKEQASAGARRMETANRARKRSWTAVRNREFFCVMQECGSEYTVLRAISRCLVFLF